jgi:hypothetical protein
VISYAFLWPDQAEAGRDDGVKDRPCVVVLAVGEGDNPLVTVAPITSRPPDEEDAIPLSAGALGLTRQSWIIPNALNLFRWPGPDLRPAGAPAGAWWRWGTLAPELRNRLADRIRARLALREGRLIRRTE